jgi:pimeloyl-ACP methyl ester carboxylesterase
MASFVLIHGSGQNADGWKRVGSLLSARGHSVAAPDLPKQQPDWGLREYARYVARSIVGPQSVIVAHSFSGVLLPLLPELRACGALVFLAAVIPEPGKSIRAQFEDDAGMFNPDWIAAGLRWTDQAHHERLAREFLFHDCDEEAIAWAMTTVELFNTRNLVVEPAPFTSWPEVPTASIVATHDRTLSADWGRRTTLRVLGKESVEIDAGHCPFVSKPAELATVLERLAAKLAA